MYKRFWGFTSDQNPRTIIKTCFNVVTKFKQIQSIIFNCYLYSIISIDV